MEESNVQVWVYDGALSQLLILSFSYCRYNVQLFTAYGDIHVFGA